MAQKTILNESEIRRFMRLASLAPLAENGFNKFANDGAIEEDEEEEEFEASEDEMGIEDPMAAAEAPGLDDAEIDISDEVPMDDMGGMDAGAGGDIEDQFMDLVRQLADLVGVEVDMEDGGEALGDMDVGAEDDLDSGDEGGDEEFEVTMSPEEDGEEVDSVGMMDDEEEDPGNRYMQEANSDKLVAEVARRVASRLQKEKGQNDIAEKLAERIFNRLSAK